jgi:REP element-mobilizing transposase RayT
MRAPRANFLSRTVYGSWLHGDARGSVDAEHNEPGTRYLDADDRCHAREKSLIGSSPSAFGPHEREVVDRTIREHCAIRAWMLLAINVRTLHAHVVVRCPLEVTPERAMDQFKAWSTRRLRETGLVPLQGKVRTRHGSTRWINSPQSLQRAIRHARVEQ